MIDDLLATDTALGKTAADDALRSEFIRSLIVTAAAEEPSSSLAGTASEDSTPRALVQFWDDLTRVPEDVQECIDSWEPAESVGFDRVLFSEDSAAEFIANHLTPRHAAAFASCGHPAMKADYFRLCCMYVAGGMYVDADDQLVGEAAALPSSRGPLYLQPLCYEIATESMIDPFAVALEGPDPGRIFYVNNNPFISPGGHPLTALALARATDQVLLYADTSRDVQSLTGPGNLSACLVEHTVRLQARAADRDYELLRNWGSVACSVWPLGYRADERNWRNWVRLPMPSLVRKVRGAQ